MAFLHWISYLQKDQLDQVFGQCAKTKSSFNGFWIVNAGIELETLMGCGWGWGEIMEAFLIMLFL